MLRYLIVHNSIETVGFMSITYDIQNYTKKNPSPHNLSYLIPRNFLFAYRRGNKVRAL